MPVHLTNFISYQFSSNDAVTYADKSLPVYRDSFGSNEYLTGIVTDTEENKLELLGAINREKSSDFTPEVQENDEDRTQTFLSLTARLNSNIRRCKKKPQMAEASEQLQDLLDLKCPNFYTANDSDQTLMIDALKTELLKEELKDGSILT